MALEIIQTRDYQVRVLSKTLAAINEGHRNILIEAPTGAGKTIMALMLAKKLHQLFGWKTGWTAMRKHLLIQAEAENNKKLGFEHITFFSTFDKIPPVEIDVLIEDEGQHSATASSTELYKSLKPKLHLGMTATPFRTDRMKLCFSKVIKDAGLRALIDQGWLTPFHQYIMHDDWTPSVVAQMYIKDVERWGKSVIYFLTENECNECACQLRDAGVKCEVVTGSSDQESQIEGFNYGDTQVLLNMVVLTEGFDSPILKSVFIRPGSKGPVIQCGGRAFRKHHSKLYANIVQNSKSHWPFTKIASAERKFICYPGGAWQSREMNEKVAQAQRASIIAIAKVDVDLPPLIKKFKKNNFFTVESN